jgi:hypothetical protein
MTVKTNDYQVGLNVTDSKNIVLEADASTGDLIISNGVANGSKTEIQRIRNDGSGMSYIPSGVGAVAGTVQVKLREFSSVMDFGAIGNGVADDTAAIQAALAAKIRVYFPVGTYRVLSPLILRTGHTIIGAGRLNSIIRSEVINDSLFKTSTVVGFLYMSDLQLRGNGLTAGSGNGHALNLIDNDMVDPTFSPAQSTFERLYIRNFRGLDRRDNIGTQIDSAAVICVNTLGLVFRDTSIENCGYGFYMQLTQNCRILEPLVTACTAWGLLSYDNENINIIGGDINNSGDTAVTNATGIPETGLYTGNVLSARDENFMLIGIKLKGSPGIAQVHAFNTSATFRDGWYRASHEIDKDFIGVLITNPVDVSVSDIDFSPTSGNAFAATKKITHVKATVASTHNIAKVRVANNQFRTQGGTLVAACVHFVGSSTSTRMEGLEVSGNSFGMPLTVAGTCRIDADVLLDNGVYSDCVVRGNTHYTSTGTVNTAIVSVSRARTSNVATIISATHGLTTGDYVTLSLFSGTGYNVYSTPVTVSSTTQFTYTSPGPDEATTADVVGRITKNSVAKVAHYALASSTYRRNGFTENVFSSQATGAIAGRFSGFNPWLETFSANKSFTIADGNKSYMYQAAGVVNLTIPANTVAPFAVGTKFTIINKNGSGVITLAVTTDGFYLAGVGSAASRAIAANGIAFVEKVTATEWIISGTGVT